MVAKKMLGDSNKTPTTIWTASFRNQIDRKKTPSNNNLVILQRRFKKDRDASLYFMFKVPEKHRNKFTDKRYVVEMTSDNLLYLVPNEKYGLKLTKNGKYYLIQFVPPTKEAQKELDAKCGYYELIRDNDRFYINLGAPVSSGSYIEEDDDVPPLEELPVPGIVSAKSDTSAKKPRIVAQTPSGRDGIVDRDALKLYDALVESTFVSIRDAERLGLTDSAYKQALNKLVRNYGYCVLSVPIIEANGTKFYVSTLYNDGEWKE